MSSLSRQHPMVWLFRSALPRLLFFAVPLMAGACDGAENPLAPADQPAAPSMESAPIAPSDAVAAAYAISASERIAFTSTRKGGYDIYKMDPFGNNVVRLTTSLDWEFSPAWSHDNKRIALVRDRKVANSASHFDIYLINADGTNGHWARSVPSGYDLGVPSWSPDGTRLVLTVQISGVRYAGWMTVATGQLGVFSTGYGGLQGQDPAYTPSGKMVYAGASGLTIDQMNADGSAHKTLVSASGGVGEPSVSPDGTRLAYEKLVGTNQDIYVKNLVSGITTRVTTYSGSDLQPTWSHDGSRLAFTSTRSGQTQIWTVGATGGAATRVTHTSTVEKDPTWTH